MRRVLISSLLAGSIGCSKAPSVPDASAAADAGPSGGPSLPQVAEAEPDDSPEAAQKLERSCLVIGQVQAVQPATRPDEDWYLVQPTLAPRDLSIELAYRGTPPPEGLQGKFVLEIYDRDRNRIQSLSGPLAAGTLATVPALRVRDALYLRIAGHQAAFPYSLKLELSTPDPNAEAEPNDRAVDATPLPFDHPLRGSYGSETDQDYYGIDLVAGGLAPADAGAVDGGAKTSDGGEPPDAGASAIPRALAAPPTEMLRIEVTAIAGLRHSLDILDDTQAPLAAFASREIGGPLLVRDFAIGAGVKRLYLRLEASHGRRKTSPAEFPSGQPYTLTVHREAAPPDLELEPNDTLELATPMVVRSVVSPDTLPGAVKTASALRIGYLSPQGDVDDYRLHLEAPARVHVLLSALDRVDTELSVVEPGAPGEPAGSGRTLLRVNEVGPKEAEVIPAITLGAGDHYLRVQAAAHQVGSKWVRDQEDPDQTYRLEVALTPDDGTFEREPNDSPALSTPILPGQTLSGFAFPAKDLDFYRLDLSTQPVATGVTLKLSGVPKVPLVLELRDGRSGGAGELLNAGEQAKPGAETQIHQKLDPGIYFLLVKAHPNSRAAGVPQSDPDVPYQLSVQMD